MAVQWVGRIGSGDEQLDRDLRDLEIVTGDAGAFLYATTGQDGGISVYRLQEGGGLARLADSAHYAVWGMGVGAFDAVSLDGQRQLVLSGVGDGKLIRYRLEDDGGLSGSGKIDLPGLTTQDHSALIAIPLNGDRTGLYTVDADSGLLACWLSTGTGGLSAAIAGPGVTLDPDGPVLLEMAEAGAQPFLLVADKGTQGVRSFRVSSETGTLAAVDTAGAGDGLGVALPSALKTVTAHGGTWVVLAAAGSNSLSVMQLTPAGQLIPTDHILDTRATRFDGVSALEVIEVDGHVFVLAGGADDGISLFTLLPDGRLVHMQTLVQDTGLGLENVTGITATRIGQEIQIFVTSGREAGIAQLSLSLAGLGAVIAAGEAPPPGGNLPLSGTGAGDLLIGRSDQITLLGQAGDDILVAGAEGGVLTGGAGNDLFVLGPTDGVLQITDFQAGADRLDLSGFPMLRSIDQLVLTATAAGATIGFGNTRIDIRSDDGKPLTAQDLWPNGFLTPDRIVVFPDRSELPRDGTPGPDLLQGGDGDDRIQAFGGNDQLYGGGGDDWLAGHDGDDRLFGEAGHDQLYGGGGNDFLAGHDGDDRMFGGIGHDQLYGGGGDDFLAGLDGNDRLFGGIGRDQLYGGGGNDFLAGHDGDDRLFGEAGHDQLYGGGGNDFLAGHDGDDRLFGGIGHDQLYGGGGDDFLAGLDGNDRLFGGIGHDQLYGGDGNDRLGGEAGHDRLYGGGGDDWLAGHDGDDRLGGEAGHDQLYGGGGNDFLAGHDGDDRLFGGIGHDQLYGGGGDDFLAGLDGNDRLFGGIGRDQLYGGGGDDFLAGLDGDDQFLFDRNHGNDTIADFAPGADRIRFSIEGLDFADLDIRNEGANGRIDTGHGSITLIGVSAGDLTADDFLFF
ncbi:hypothetical protein QO034_15725 [Sedimentitalea sp. JM2-8]|uniref:Ca2+-binding protein, RTX toxin-related n=1 Tax=Sedimentitalea xiamensis TaxID=3050037 RepID=A0ABT7FHH6_9RHOB|nr:hypothetical protein [Sedimentitalea xiamensis]MDK3074547.1 hypothetical protein [Sedimentitalea xiamensis]